MASERDLIGENETSAGCIRAVKKIFIFLFFS
jgi:hypothetical protein